MINRIKNLKNSDLNAIAAELAAALAYTQQVNGRQQIVTPLIYPSSSFVVLVIEKSEKGYFLSDFGGASRETDLMGGRALFKRIAKKQALYYGVNFDSEMIFDIDVTIDNLVAAAAAIANASKSTVEDVTESLMRKKSEKQRDQLYRKLFSVFPRDSIQENFSYSGRSEEWEFDAGIIFEKPILFQLVSPNINSINSTLTKFFDVKDNGSDQTVRVSLPAKFTDTPLIPLLSRVSTIVKIDDPDRIYTNLKKAA